MTFNLTPVLMLQVKELIEGRIRDQWLEWARKPAADLEEEEVTRAVHVADAVRFRPTSLREADASAAQSA